MTSFRHTSVVHLPPFGIGTRQQVIFHEYIPAGGKPFDPDSSELKLEDFAIDRAYIQASLHCDELPGMLVTHHFLKLLDAAASQNGILKAITVLPYANPIGLQQIIMGSHLGRFSLSTGVNFNRDWIDVTSSVLASVESQLSESSSSQNTAVIRRALFEETKKLTFNTVEKVLKKTLFQRAAIASISIDLHCDTDAVMHMYTHDRLWPKMQDLAVCLQAQCTLLSPESGGVPFDEACSCPWSSLMDHFQDRFPIEMGCQSATVELRGESDVRYNFLSSLF
jgi:predicted deacylase